APPLPTVAKPGISAGGSYPAAGQLLARLQLEGDAPGAYPYHAPPSTPQPASAPTPSPTKPKLGAKTIARAQRLLHRNRSKPALGAAEPNTAAPPQPAFNPPDLPPVYTA